MKVTKAEIQIPDECGEFCPRMKEEGIKYPFSYQGDVCHRCPIVNCSGEDPLIEPEDYSPALLNRYLESWGMKKY